MTSKKIVISILLIVFFWSGCLPNLTKVNSSETKSLVSNINHELIKYYPNEFYTKYGMEAYGVNNGIIIFVDKNAEAKFSNEHNDLLKEINHIFLKEIDNNCNKIKEVEFYCINVGYTLINYYQNKNELIRTCNQNKDLVHNSNKHIPDYVKEAVRRVSMAVQYKKNYTGDRGENVIYEP